METKKTKQVIVIRKDLKMRRGKEIAQSCHGSNAILTNNLIGYPFSLMKMPLFLIKFLYLFFFHTAFRLWLTNSFTKICVTVNSEEELLEIYKKAKSAGVLCSLIKDSGRTEFHGVPTYTVACIGPDYEDKINKITGELSLY